MTTFRTFEEMDAWKEARILSQKIRSICKRPVVQHDFAFVDQITRACRSIAANIAEGNDATTTAEFVTFLGYSKRSTAEVRSHLYDALDERYVTQEEFTELVELSKKISRMLSKLMSYLEHRNGNQRRIPY